MQPVTEAGVAGVTVYFPGTNEVWYDVDTYDKYDSQQSVYIATPLSKVLS